MREDFQVWYRNHKDLVDQPLHFLMTFVPVVLCLIHPVMSVIPALMFALSREYYQHDRVIVWNFDLAFAYAGALAGVVVLIFV